MTNCSKNRICSATIALFLLMLTACGTVSPQGSTSPPPPSGDATEGSSIGDFMLKDVDGKTHALSDYLGQNVIVISFFAMWCEPCKKEMGHMQKMFTTHKTDGLMLLAISMDEPETQGDVRPYIKKRGFTFPVLLDTEGRAADQFNPKRDAPFNLIIDKNRNVVWEKSGYVQGDEKVLERNVLKALGKQPPTAH